MVPLLSLTESNSLEALRTFLLNTVISGTEVIRAQVNRVPEPRSADFLVLTPLRYERLETNETSYRDYDVVGSIAGDVMTVTAVGHGALEAGMTLTGTSGLILVDTTIVAQLGGSAGGTGTYRVSKSQTIGSGVIYAGLRDDTVATELTIQVDAHGPNGLNNCLRIEALFRSEVGWDGIRTSGFAVAPLYTNPPRQMPFINAEQAYEDRWVLELVLQVTPVVSTWQQFMDEIIPTTIEVETTYPP